MECAVLTTDAELAALVPEWDSLQQRAGNNLFTAPFWVENGRRFLSKDAALHIVTGREDGRLAAVAPLAVRRKRGVRILEWAAGETQDYSDFLVEKSEHAAALWEAVRASRRYDLAHIKEVHPQAVCLAGLEDVAQAVRTTEALHMQLTAPTFDDWLKTLPYAMRKQYRARLKQAQAMGALRYDVWRDAVPEEALAALIAQKTDWAKALGKRGVFDLTGVHDFYRAIIAAAAKDGTLHFSALRCGGDIIAAHLGFVQGGRYLSYMPSYSARWSTISPGRLLLFHCIGWAIENGCGEYDFMRGGEDYKSSFATGGRNLKDFLFARSLLGRAARFIYVRRANDGLKKAHF